MKSKHDIIFIAGAPGTGKSSVAKALQAEIKTPLFEFGWIPEFRYTGETTILYEEDEALAINEKIRQRDTLPHEIKIDTTRESIEEIVKKIEHHLN